MANVQRSEEKNARAQRPRENRLRVACIQTHMTLHRTERHNCASQANCQTMRPNFEAEQELVEGKALKCVAEKANQESKEPWKSRMGKGRTKIHET
eukprot:6182455-Pleurochrysis_carterae.AAC.1